MKFSLALGALLRRPARSLLAVLGVAVAAAMLLDMVMLSTGMRESFKELLLTRGFDIRLSPSGTLPFDTEATVGNVAELLEQLRLRPDVAVASPVLGGALFLRATTADPASAQTTGAQRTNAVITAIGLGIFPDVQGDYDLVSGNNPEERGEIVVNSDLLATLALQVGDSVTVAAGYDPQLAIFSGERRLRISGEGRFLYLSRGQLAAAVHITQLQEMSDARQRDRASLIMLKLREGVNTDSALKDIAGQFPSVTATSISTALEAVDERLSYFRQLAFILGSVSLVVGFLLVTTLVTISVNERIGEIAVLRAIGVSRLNVLQMILVEGFVLSMAGTVFGLLLGLVTARFLNGILSQFPGLPQAIDFFLFQPAAVWRALGMLVLVGVAAGVVPAWRAASLMIATTLRREAVA